MTAAGWVKALAMVLVAVGTASAVSLAIAAAAGVDGVTAEHSFTQSAELAGAGEVSIDLASGDVTVQAGPDGQVLVEERDAVRAPTRGLARLGLETVHSTMSTGPDGVRIENSADRRWPFATETERRVGVHVPKNTRLRVNTAAARVTIIGLGGDVSVDSAAGAVLLRDMDVSGQLSVHLSSGAINFDGKISGGHIDLRTVSGTVLAVIPRATNAHLEASTVAGPIVIDNRLPVRVLGTPGRGENVNGDIGSGGPATLTLNTISGPIVINTR